MTSFFIKSKYFLLVCCFLLIAKAGTAQVINLAPDTAYLNKLIQVAKTNYPKVKSYQNRINIAKTNVSKADLSYLDVITFSYVYQPHSATIVNTSSAVGSTSTSTGSTSSTQPYSYFNGIQAGIYFNLGYYLEKPSLKRQAKEELAIAHNEQDEYFLMLVNDVKKRYYTYIMRLAEVKLQTQSTIDAEETLKNLKYKFEKGEETYDNYNKAQLTFTDRNQTLNLAQSNLLIAKSDLEEVLGEKLENIK